MVMMRDNDAVQDQSRVAVPTIWPSGRPTPNRPRLRSALEDHPLADQIAHGQRGTRNTAPAVSRIQESMGSSGCRRVGGPEPVLPGTASDSPPRTNGSTARTQVAAVRG